MAGKYDGDSSKLLAQGLEVVVGVGLGYVVGNWADHKYGLHSWGLYIGLLLGLSAGMYLLVRDAVKANKPPENKP